MSGSTQRRASVDPIAAPPTAPGSPPEGFVAYRRSSPYLELIGPIYEAATDPLVIGLWPERKHCNARGFVHAGLLVALVDSVLGHTILREFAGSPPIVTVSLTTHFIGPAHQGTWLQGEASVNRHGSRLSFADAVFRSEDRVIMTASGIFATQTAP